MNIHRRLISPILPRKILPKTQTFLSRAAWNFPSLCEGESKFIELSKPFVDGEHTAGYQ
jgi:hypothetical protein